MTLYQSGDGEFVDHSCRPMHLRLRFLLSPTRSNSVDLQDLSKWQGAADLQGRYFKAERSTVLHIDACGGWGVGGAWVHRYTLHYDGWVSCKGSGQRD